ncbi:DUF1534 domain-containing protein, partial [Pseudomonas syringae]|nr:DUF1534 domain-containing protein [Pseudomonas syringae]
GTIVTRFSFRTLQRGNAFHDALRRKGSRASGMACQCGALA